MWLAGFAATSSGVPSATTWPPPAPPSGPMSIIQSAVLITSRLCSITTIVLPASRSWCSTLQQQVDVGEVQAGGRLVEDVERAAGVALGELERQLDALRLAARQRGRALAEADVAEADVEQRLQLARDGRHGAEVAVRVLHRQVSTCGDVACPCRGSRASRGCSAGRGRRRRARRRRAGSASRPSARRRPGRPRSGRRRR